MGNLVEFSAVNSKMMAIKGKMIKKDIYDELLNAKDYNKVVEILRDKTHYKNLLEREDISVLRRLNLEMLLNKNFVSLLEKLSHYFSGDYKKVISILFLRYEVEDLKLIIRGKFIEKDKEDIKKALLFRSKLNTIDYDYLIEAKNLDDLSERLKGSIYYKTIKRNIDKVDKSLFMLETELDFLYFSSIRKIVKKLNKENRKALEIIIGFQADLANLSWIYRGKFYYEITPEELYNFTIYDRYKLKKDLIKNLCYAKGIDEFRDLIRKFPYKSIYDTTDVANIQLNEKECLKKFVSKIFSKNESNLSTLLSFIILYRLEINEIITIAEEKRYSLDFDESKEYVAMN